MTIQAVICLILAIPCLFLGIYTASQTRSDQIYQAEGYMDLIQVASSFIENFDKHHSRLPTREEYDSWLKSNPRHDGWGFSFHGSHFPKDLIKTFGTAPPKGYALGFWNGDNFVIYPSWGGQKDLAYIPESEYFIFGSKVLDLFVFWGVWFFLTTAAVFLIKMRPGVRCVK